jgi:uncharacterized membrane protein
MTKTAKPELLGDHLISVLLQTGTWLACALIILGWLIQWFAGPGSSQFAAIGIDTSWSGVATFILLPSLRVALMVCLFARQRDYTYVAIAACVLLVIGFGSFFAVWIGR